MSDKNLTELEWKKFSKGKGFKDSAFVKALGALEKARTPDLQLAALAEIEKQAGALRKAHQAEKPLGEYLDGLDKALDKERKAADFEARRAARAEEEEETPALLTTKMLPLLRQVRKGESMQVLLGVAGQEVGVLVSRRAIPPTRRKLISDYVGAGTLKFFPGHCIFEENAYTFVMKTQAAGLAKKVKAALLKQIEVRLKVRVRGEDPKDIDDDGDPAEPEEGAEATNAAVVPPAPPLAPAREPASAPASAAAVARPPATRPPAGDPPAAKPVAASVPDAPPISNTAAAAADPQQATFESRMAAIEPRVLAALRDQRGDVSKIRAVAAFVREKGDTGQYKAALGGMESLAKLLEAADGAPAAPPMAAPETRAPAPAAQGAEAQAFTARLAALMPAVKAAIAAGGERAQDIKLKVSEAGVYARKQTFDQANGLLDEAEKLLGTTSAGVPDAPAMPAAGAAPGAPAAPAAPADAATTAFNQRLATVLPGVKAATGPDAADFKLRISEAGALARKKDFAAADAVLDAIEAALKAADPSKAEKPEGEIRAETAEPAEVAEVEPAVDDPEEEVRVASLNSAWDERIEAVEARYLQVLRGNPAGGGELRTVMAYALDQHEDGQNTKALAALDRLEKLLDAAASAKNEAGYTGIVEYRKTLLDLRAAVARVDGQIAALVRAIPEDSPDEADLAEELGALLGAANEELQDLVDEAMGTAENEDTPITRALAERLDLLIDKVGRNDLIKHVDTYPSGVAMTVEETLTTALKRVRAALPVAA